jgi:hypothetical protein
MSEQIKTSDYMDYKKLGVTAEELDAMSNEELLALCNAHDDSGEWREVPEEELTEAERQRAAELTEVFKRWFAIRDTLTIGDQTREVWEQ